MNHSVTNNLLDMVGNTPLVRGYEIRYGQMPLVP